MDAFYENFSQFLEKPNRETLREILTSNFGETNSMISPQKGRNHKSDIFFERFWL